jgi:hypothetical protein
MIGGAVLGYLLGNRIDRKRLRVILEPGPRSGDPAGSRQSPDAGILERENMPEAPAREDETPPAFPAR